MAAIPNTNVTILDWLKSRNPKGGIARMANALAQTNEILLDAPVRPANNTLSHRVTAVASLPEVSWRDFNRGTAATKGTTLQWDEGMATMESFSVVDAEIAEQEGDTLAFLASRAVMHLSAMNNRQATALFYEDESTNPSGYNGLATRYNDLDGENGQNILDAGGSGSDLTSIWLVNWSDQTAYLTFPPGSMAGLQQKDHGKQLLQHVGGETGKYMEAYVEQFQWKTGFALEMWPHIVRICNIDVSDQLQPTGTGAWSVATNIVKLMLKATVLVPRNVPGRLRWYLNPTMYAALMTQALDRSSSGVLSLQQAANQFGDSRTWMTAFGIPVRQCDAITNTETRVTA